MAAFALISRDMPLDELVGMIAIQCVPASFGAMIARKQLSGGEHEEDAEQAARSAGYGGQLFLMMAGALFFAFNVAPTEEIILIGFKMTAAHTLVMMLASLLLLHLLVFAIGFPGQETEPEDDSLIRRVLVYTIPGYAIALLVSLYVLWTFGRIDGSAIATIAGSVVVLGFPSAVGAAIARLVV